jgi:hypothetical protein
VKNVQSASFLVWTYIPLKGNDIKSHLLEVKKMRFFFEERFQGFVDCPDWAMDKGLKVDA